MSRLIVISNRVALPTGARAPGGLAVGLYDALRDSGGLWLGWNGQIADEGEVAVSTMTRDNITYATFPLAQHDYDRFYRGFSNTVLWPVFHYRPDLLRYRRADYQGYQKVNRDFAARLAPLLRPDDVIWVHDYHLLPLGAYCRELGIRNRIGFFLHIPFPAASLFETIPPHRELAQAMCAYDVAGFQTESDAQAFGDYCVRHLGAQRRADGLHTGARALKAGAYPIGIDVDDVAAMSRKKGSSQMKALKLELADRKLIISVDRLDYSKGLLERFAAFEQLLEMAPDHGSHVSFVQLAQSSRSDVQGYREIRRELDRAAGRINGKWGDLGWAPLHYINRSYSRATLMPLMGASQVGLVTPLRDGMNLVAKEYVAAQPPDDPGVLVLSQFAGAASEMQDAALIVNPYDIEGMAHVLDQALRMPLAERVERHRSLMQGLRKRDLENWKNRFLADLRGATAPMPDHASAQTV